MPAHPTPAAHTAHTIGSEFVSDLAERAAAIRAERAAEQAERDRFTAQQQAEAVVFRGALTLKCHVHNAEPGRPCWKLPADDKHHRAGKAVCSSRIDRAIGVAKIKRERETHEQKKAARQQARGR